MQVKIKIEDADYNYKLADRETVSSIEYIVKKRKEKKYKKKSSIMWKIFLQKRRSFKYYVVYSKCAVDFLIIGSQGPG